MTPPQARLPAEDRDHKPSTRKTALRPRNEGGRVQKKKPNPSSDYVNDEDYVEKDHDTPIDKKMRTFLRTQQNNMIKKCSELYSHPLQKEISNLQHEKQQIIGECNSELQAKGKEIEQIKQNTLKLLVSKGHDAEDDATIRAHFQLCLMKIKNVAKSISKEGFADTLDDAARSRVLEALDAGPNRALSKIEVPLGFDHAVAISTIFNALLSKHIFTTLLSQPFFFLSGVQINHLSVDLSVAIDKLYQIGQNVNADRANVWLADTMALLHPKGVLNHKVRINDSQSIETSKVGQYASCARSFLQIPVVKLLSKLCSPEDVQKRIQEVSNLVTEIGELLLRLANQKARMKLMAYDELSTCPLTGNEILMNPHSSLAIDSFEDFHNKWTMFMVVTPAIVAYGKEDGTGYNEYKVWAPSVVLAGSKDKTLRNSKASAFSHFVDLTDKAVNPLYTGKTNIATSNDVTNPEAITRPDLDANPDEEIAYINTASDNKDNLPTECGGVISPAPSCSISESMAAIKHTTPEVGTVSGFDPQAQLPYSDFYSMTSPPDADAVFIKREAPEKGTLISRIREDNKKRPAERMVEDLPSKKARNEQSPLASCGQTEQDCRRIDYMVAATAEATESILCGDIDNPQQDQTPS